MGFHFPNWRLYRTKEIRDIFHERFIELRIRFSSHFRILAKQFWNNRKCVVDRFSSLLYLSNYPSRVLR